ncbi:uncharacterized protein LOC135138567 [Zophobas morio]|uniref:uncharacterized protein LOC135138567 n=1 Tax=Zophobas morio TaxID=2755281 RepID=UPI003082B830
MEETPADPLDISKEQDLIKDAQKELSKIDVLVCGGCHEVFHFVEEFQKHKTSNECTNISVLKCENEEKSQIWGFTLWKVKQVKTCKSNGEELPTSWEIYQKWTKLNQIEKDLWISAGRTLQYTHKVGTGKMQVVREEKKVEKDPLAMDEDGAVENEVSSNCTKTEILKNVTIIQGSKKGLRTTKDNEREEYNVEKIIGKRFNPRKRLWEYEVKWESYQEPSWEPLAHLENCKALVQEFEDKLKAEKELKEKEKPPSRGRGRPRLNPQSPGAVKVVQKKPPLPPTSTVLITTPGGRPQRTSKQKALNQVKAWCGNISDEEGGLKRPFDDDVESDDSFEKRMKLEGESEDTEEDEPKMPVRKVAKIVHTYNNGTGKKLPDNVLIPDAKGVVRISQKQLPSLSSGVYIMSKSSGIIKLDPTASKIATSGGQAIVKVSPKIGQTQIKIIKKEDGSKRVVQVKGPEAATTTTTATITPSLTPIAPKPKVVQQVVNRTPIVKKDVKKVETPKAQPIKVVEKKEEVKAPVENDEDSDDGIPELEFPTDLPLPGPESPPGEFTLDPFTGKVAGMDYPEVEEAVEEKKDATEEEKKDGAKSLDNIVKLAAADITEDDLKPDLEVTTSENNPASTTPSVSTVTVTTAAVTVTASKTPVVTPAAPVAVAVLATTTPKTTQSILSAAMANSNILQKTLQSPPPRPKTQPRIINQSVARPRTAIGQVVRTPSQPRPSAAPRPRPQILPRPKFNISSMSPVKNVYSAKTNNVAKKVNTPVQKPRPTPTTPQLLKKSAHKAAPKPSISMPTLDEEPAAMVLAPKVAQVVSEVPTVEADLSTFTLATTDRPMFITGDDGTVYQVAGQNEEGQTILVTQDSDGQQQCLLVTSEAIQEEVEQGESQGQVLMEVQEPVEVAEEQPLVAQFIRTEPPSPGGTHKVVVMLPDGDVMVTQVTPEEYASLELDK